MTETIPKCLLDVGGCSVLAAQLRMLGQIGVTDVVVVTGHAAWRLEELAISRFRCVHNPDFAVSNQAASLWAARIHTGDREKLVRLMAGLSGGAFLDEEFRFRCADGKTRWLRMRMTPAPGPPGDPHAAAGIAWANEEVKSARRKAHQGISILQSAGAPIFFTDIEGKTLTRDDLAGRAVLVDFWATWCPPCRGTLPWIAELRKRHGDRLAVIAAIGVLVKFCGPCRIRYASAAPYLLLGWMGGSKVILSRVPFGVPVGLFFTRFSPSSVTTSYFDRSSSKPSG